MERDHARLHRSLAVLGPPRRFQLMLLMLSGVDRSVSQLARAVRLSQSCTTRHLQALERAGLVKGTRDGKRVVFRPAPRDATARGVLASLLESAEDEVLAAGITAGAIPVASTAELEPLMESGRESEREEVRRERVTRATRRARPPRIEATGLTMDAVPAPAGSEREFAQADQPPAPHDEPESGNTSAHIQAPAWRSSDIEDFLL